jgi:hypothetical protein
MGDRLTTPNLRMQRMGAGRLAYLQIGDLWRLAPTADTTR